MTKAYKVIRWKFPGKEFTTRGNAVEFHDGSPAPTQQELEEWTAEFEKHYLANVQYPNALKELLKKTARQKNYDDESSIASYSDSTNAEWKQEATDFIAWRDACWQYAYQVQSDVESGQIAPSLDNFIANTPKINWST